MTSLRPTDLAIVCIYVLTIVASGFVLSRRASKNVDSYFLGGRTIPWYFLGVSNASGMFDITGTMWMVAIMFVYGVKSIWLPWAWPTFNQIFLMVYLAVWIRRSQVLTGAEWLQTRFGRGVGLELCHIAIVFYALVLVIGMIAYAFEGVGKFATFFFPWELSADTYALVILLVTATYVIAGGMYSVVVTDVIQFLLMTIVSCWIAVIAVSQTTAEQITRAVPEGWDRITFGWRLDLDWSRHIEQANATINEDEVYHLFAAFFMLVLMKGILASLAGPTPGYDLQRILATRTPRESALMSGLVSPVLLVPRYFLITGVVVLALVNFNEELLTQSSVQNAATAADPANGSQKVDFEQVLPFIVSRLPVVLTGLMLAGLLAAFMSTFDSTVNAGAAYVVNDIYQRYFAPEKSSTHYFTMGFCSLLIVLVGIFFGYRVRKIDTIMQWITAGLFGGYVAPNVLKWHWWRLNGAGFFSGMVTGTLLAILQVALKETPYRFLPAEPLHAFPFVLLASAIGSVAGSLATRPDDRKVLMEFYRQVQPWGVWGPVRRWCVEAGHPVPERGRAARDLVNCGVGIVWQTSLTAVPVFLVIRKWPSLWIALTTVIVTTVFLKYNWYDKLPE